MILEENKNITKENKTFKILGNISFIVFMALMVLMIVMVGQSKFTGQEPSLLGHRVYIVDSGSMEPTVPINSMIIIKETPSSEIVKDDIVAYYSGSQNTRVTHRVVGIEEDGQSFITRGDANNVEDPNILPGEKIIGKLVFTIPYIGMVLRNLNGKVGIVLLVILGAMWIIIPKLLKKFTVN